MDKGSCNGFILSPGFSKNSGKVKSVVLYVCIGALSTCSIPSGSTVSIGAVDIDRMWHQAHAAAVPHSPVP